MTSTRVLQWATGATGMHALRAVIESDELELAGVRVYDEAKAGKDAGDLAGTASTGIAATADRAEALDIDADVVLYMARSEYDLPSSLADVAELLRRGRDVITTGSSFIDIWHFAPDVAHEIEAACEVGASTFLGVGIYPGFWGECITPLLSRISFRRGRITVRESLSYAGYTSAPILFDGMGYGRPPRTGAPNPRAGAPWLSTAHLIAKSLGLDVKSSELIHESRITDREIQVTAGVIAPGTVAAIKSGIRVDCGDLEIVVEHVTWMDEAVEPAWSEREGYEVEFDGAPTLRCHLVLGTDGENKTEMGCLGTAMHAVHSIPVVRNAGPGLVDLADVQPAFWTIP